MAATTVTDFVLRYCCQTQPDWPWFSMIKEAVAKSLLLCRKIGRLEQLFALCMAVFGAALSIIGTIQAVLKIAAGTV